MQTGDRWSGLAGAIPVTQLKSVTELSQLLKTKRFDFSYTQGKIHFNPLLTLSIASLEDALVTFQKLTAPIGPPVVETPTTPVIAVPAAEPEPITTKLPIEPAKPAAKPKTAKAEPKAKTPKVVAPLIKPAKTIAWDKEHEFKEGTACGIFKLFSPFSNGNYLYVDPVLADEVYATNKLAYQDLMRMCDVGHVLVGSSKKRKGFLIHGKPFEKAPKPTEKKLEKKTDIPEAYIKGKNCVKDWRFYGNAKKVTMIDGKLYTLFGIDSWSPDHKSKIKKVAAGTRLKP